MRPAARDSLRVSRGGNLDLFNLEMDLFNLEIDPFDPGNWVQGSGVACRGSGVACRGSGRAGSDVMCVVLKNDRAGV